MYQSLISVLSKAGMIMTDDDDWVVLFTTSNFSNENIKSITAHK
jgi:hypothetical protein